MTARWVPRSGSRAPTTLVPPPNGIHSEVFGRLPIGYLLYVVLAVYLVLVAYELWLLEQLTAGFLGS